MKQFTDNHPLWGPRNFIVPETAADVSDEILDLAFETAEGWFPDRIDWEDLWDRMEGTQLKTGKYLSWGDEFGTPAMKKVQRHVNKIRRES